MTSDIEPRIERLEVLLSNPDVSPETRVDVAEKRDSISTDLDYIRRGDSGYEDHLLEAIRDSEDACSCTMKTCDLKHGKVPQRVRRSDEPVDEALRRFRHEHGGAEVLDDAREDWAERTNRVRETISECITLVQEDIAQ